MYRKAMHAQGYSDEQMAQIEEADRKNAEEMAWWDAKTPPDKNPAFMRNLSIIPLAVASKVLRIVGFMFAKVESTQR